MMSHRLKAAILLFGAPLLAVILSVAFILVQGTYGADPDYGYLLNGLNFLHLRGPGHADHPGTPVQLLAAVVIGAISLVRSLVHGRLSLDGDVLRHPELYLTCINLMLALLTAAALAFCGRQLFRATGSLAVAMVGQLTFLVSMPVLISLPRVTPEPLLITLTALLVGLMAPAITDPSFPRPRLGPALLVGATIGACMATKITSAPLILTIALLRGVRFQIAAFIAMVASAILLTLPAAAFYGALLHWVIALAIHSNNYGEGAVGLPPVSALLDHIALLFWSFPAAFVAIAFCGVALLWQRNGTMSDYRVPKRLFVGCALVILLQLIAVAKHYSLRYALPAVAMVALANAAVVYIGMAFRGSLKAVFSTIIVVLLGLGFWRAWGDVSDWYGTPYAIAREDQDLVANAAKSGCTFVPYYGASSQDFNLFFGDRLARGAFSPQLAAVYPDFVTYNGRGFEFEDFVQVLTPAEAARRLSAKKCVYLFGSPLERFSGSGFLELDLISIARSSGGVGEALAIYQLPSHIIDKFRSEAAR